MNKIIFKNGLVCRKGTLEKGKAVIVEKGKITAVKEQGSVKVKKSDEVINLKGKILVPGFIDVHIHGSGGLNAQSGDPDAIPTMSKTLAQFGITGYLATIHYNIKGDNTHILAIRSSIKKKLDGARCLGIHMEGPFIDLGKRGMILPRNIFAPTKKRINDLLKLTDSSLKILTVAPELPGALNAIKEFNKRKIIVSLGHTNANFEEATKGFEAGIKHVTHMFNTMRAFTHRDPGSVGAVFLKKNIFVELISDGVHVHKEAIETLLNIVGKKHICLISDSINAGAKRNKLYKYNQFEYKAEKDGAARHKSGKLVGTTLPLSKLAYRMQKFTKLPFPDVVDMCSLNPSRSLNSRKKGKIEIGCDADLAVMDMRFNNYLTMVGGKIVFKK